MTEIRFYHLEQQSIEQALPLLISKIYDKGHKIIIRSENEKQIEKLNTLLWTSDPNSFLPHGSLKEGDADMHPIWLTTKDENPNEADVLVLLDGCVSAIQDKFTICCEMFNGNDPDILKRARNNWKTYKDKDVSLSYWQQKEGHWVQKN